MRKNKQQRGARDADASRYRPLAVQGDRFFARAFWIRSSAKQTHNVHRRRDERVLAGRARRTRAGAVFGRAVWHRRAAAVHRLPDAGAARPALCAVALRGALASPVRARLVLAEGGLCLVRLSSFAAAAIVHSRCLVACRPTSPICQHQWCDGSPRARSTLNARRATGRRRPASSASSVRASARRPWRSRSPARRRRTPHAARLAAQQCARRLLVNARFERFQRRCLASRRWRRRVAAAASARVDADLVERVDPAQGSAARHNIDRSGDIKLALDRRLSDYLSLAA